MRHRSHQAAAERAARSAVRKLLDQGTPVLTGSLVTMKRRCGKDGCRCARGQKHVSLYLAARLDGKRKMIYVPRELEEKVRQWVSDGRQASRLLDVISRAALDALVKEKKAMASRRKGQRR